MAEASVSGAQKHAGLEGTTSLECCDASVPVLSVWECLNAFLASAVDTPILLLLANLRCPSCQRMIPTFNIITTVTSVDFRKLQQRISIAAQDALDVWPEATITTLLKNGLNQLTDEPWINMRPLFEAMSVAQIQEFLTLHLAPPSNPFLNGASQAQATDTPSSDGSLSQFQSEQKRVKPNDDATTDEYTRTGLMAQISSCRKCRDTVKQAAWSVAASAVLSCIRRLLRREVERGALFEQALLLGGAVAGDPGNSASATGRTGTSTGAAAVTATVTVTAASDGVFSDTVHAGDEYGDDSDEGMPPSVTAKGKKSKPKYGFVKGTGYAGDAKEDARIVQRARAQQAELQAATATIMLHAVDMLHAIVKACLKRDDMLPTFMTGPHAVLVEGGLAHCLHSMLTHQPLDSLVNSPKLLEGQLKLLNAVLLAAPLQATLLMPAGQPPVAAARHDVRTVACGYGSEGPSIADAMQGLERAADVLKSHAMGCNEVNEDGLHVGIDEALNLALYITSTSSRLTENLEDIDELVDLPPVPTHILNGATQAPVAVNGAVASGIPDPTAQLRAAHERALRRIGVIYAPLQHCHAFRHEAEVMDITSSSAKTRIRDVTKAVTALQGQLPIAWGSSVHVAIDEDRPDLFRVLVIPDQETPYANGAFLFDFILPKDFPNHPPKAKFLTTGGGSVRFNPNLYNCGKVCLSLLGTWQGPSWDPTTSTILQVLVSLQAMVFCRDPYFNEPGYERTAGTSTGESHSAKYNAGITYNSMKYAIRAPLENPLSQPHAPFQDILALHWKHKRDSILAHLIASKDDVIKHHGTSTRTLATIALGGPADAGAGMNTVDSLISDITRLLDSFEERYSVALEKEAAQNATVAAEEREKRETDEKERMFQRMQEELAMHIDA